MIEQKDLERLWKWCGHEPDITLDNLFEWAVPKLYTTVQIEEISFARENGQELAMVCYWTGKKEEDTLGVQVKAAHADTPAEALTQAILQVIDKHGKVEATQAVD